MRSLFARSPLADVIGELPIEAEHPGDLRRTLVAEDLVLVSVVGAVIGAGILASLGASPHVATILTGPIVAIPALVVDDDATYDLTIIGTLLAFAVVCVGVLVLRIREPGRPRPFRVPFVWLVALGAAGACVFVMQGLPAHAWLRFGAWLATGVAIHHAYGFRHSVLRRGGGSPQPPEQR